MTLVQHPQVCEYVSNTPGSGELYQRERTAMSKIVFAVSIFISVVVSLYRQVLGRETLGQSDRGDGNESAGSSYSLSSDSGGDGGDSGD